MSNLQSSAVNRTITVIFYDITNTSELFAQFLDGAVLSNEFLKWISEKPNAVCTAIMSAIDGKCFRRATLVKASTLLTRTNGALVEFGTEQIRQEEILAHAMRKLVEKEQCVAFLVRAVLGADMNGVASMKDGMQLQSSLQEELTALFHSFSKPDATAFQVVLYCTALVHSDGMIRDKKISTHLRFKEGNCVHIAVSLLSLALEQLLCISEMRTSIKGVLLYMQLNL